MSFLARIILFAPFCKYVDVNNKLETGVKMKVFGYPEFDENGIMPVTQYEGEYAGMMMDIFLKKLDAGETIGLSRSGEEIAALLLSGDVTFR